VASAGSKGESNIHHKDYYYSNVSSSRWVAGRLFRGNYSYFLEMSARGRLGLLSSIESEHDKKPIRNNPSRVSPFLLRACNVSESGRARLYSCVSCRRDWQTTAQKRKLSSSSSLRQDQRQETLLAELYNTKNHKAPSAHGGCGKMKIACKYLK